MHNEQYPLRRLNNDHHPCLDVVHIVGLDNINPQTESLLDVTHVGVDIEKAGWRGIAHIGLDIIGFIPGLGEPADFTNAVWYVQERDYVAAILSLISMIPEAGDIPAKLAKYQQKKLVKFFLTHADDILKWWRIIRHAIIISTKLSKHFSKEVIGILDKKVKELTSKDEATIKKAGL